ARAPPGSRAAPDDGVEPRLPEPVRRCSRCARDRPERDRGGRAARDLALVRARAGGIGAAVPSVRRRCLHLRRLRQGALAAVPDLARASGGACPRPPWPRRGAPARGLPRTHAALVPVPLLAPGAALRRGGVLARP